MSAFGGDARRGRARRRLDARLAGRVLFALVVPASALALGSLYTGALAGMTVLAWVAAWLLGAGAAPDARPRDRSVVLVALALALVAYTALQLVPVPLGVLGFLSPESADVHLRALVPLGEAPPSFVPISLDPAATRVEVLRGLFYLAVLLGALRLVEDEEGKGRLLLERIVLASSVTMGLVALLHPAFHAERVFGAYTPRNFVLAPGTVVAPLLNPNHLAGYLNVGACVAAGASLTRKGAVPRPVALASALLLVGVSLSAGSRGGTASLVVGLALVLALALARRGPERARIVGPALGVVVVLVGGVLLGLASSEGARTDLSDHGLSKLQLVRNGLALVVRYPWTGVGRGAFESTFPAVMRGSDYVVYTHPEDFLVQWASEWGVPVTLAALATLVWVLSPRAMLERSRPPVGPWAALAAVGLHNVVDFATEVPGVVALLTAVAALVVGGTARAPDAPRSTRRRWVAALGRAVVRRRTVAVLGVTSVAAAAVAVASASRELHAERRTGEAAVAQAPDAERSDDPVAAALVASVRRHPAEPYFPYLLALRAFQRRDPGFVAWAARTLERSPVHGRTHLLLGRGLATRYPAQARLELRLALQQDGSLFEEVVRDGLRLATDEDAARELVPEGPLQAMVLERLVAGLEPRLPSTAARLDATLASVAPLAYGPHLREARRTLGERRDGARWCDDVCLAQGVAAAKRAAELHKTDCEATKLTAQLVAAKGEVDAALQLLERALHENGDRPGCLRAMVDVANEHGRARSVDAAMDSLLRAGCLRLGECVQNALFAAGYFRSVGRPERALAACKRGLDQAPDDESLLAALGEVASSLGLHAEAFDAYTKLSRRNPADATFREAAAREHDAITATNPSRRGP